MLDILTVKELLAHARGNGYAVAAFNVCNFEFVKAVLDEAEAKRAPVIVQAHYLETAYAGAACVMDLVRNAGRGKRGVVAVHLDHGDTYQQVMDCIRGGFTGVMYDGSRKPLEENVRVLRKCVESAHAVGVSVEGEIGVVGTTEALANDPDRIPMSDPAQAKELVEETGVDCLAVAVGNAHGLYAGEPKLDLARLRALADAAGVPLVLHGGTGIPADQIRRAIALGVAKVNFSTTQRLAYLNGIKRYLASNPDSVDVMAMNRSGMDAVRRVVAQAIDFCGCANKV